MAGFYINLDRDQERRTRLERQLATYGLQDAFGRCPGIDGSTMARGKSPLGPGEIGCFRSHLAALRLARASGGPAQILEDDVVLSPAYARLMSTAPSSGLFNTFDIVFTDTTLQPELAALYQLKRGIDAALAARTSGEDFLPSFLEITRRSFSSAVSYFVAPRALDKVIRLVETECLEGPRLPYDLFLRAVANQGLLRVACTVPFLTCVRLEDIASTNIKTRAMQDGNPTVLAARLLRYAFFIDGDVEGYARPFANQVPSPHDPSSGDSRLDLVMKIIAFMLSDKFAKF